MSPLVANTLYAVFTALGVFTVIGLLLAGFLLLYRRRLRKEKQRKEKAQKVLKGMAKRWRDRKLQRALKVQYEAKAAKDAAAAEALRKDATRQFTAEEDEYIWKAIDKNGNGMLSRADIEEAFRLIDKNGNGVLSRAEVIKACRASERVHTLLGLPKNIRQEDGTRDLFELVFQELDADGSKSITLDEFTSYLRKSRSSHHLGKDNPIWEQISGKLSRRLPDGVRNRYLELQRIEIEKEEEAKRPFTAEDDEVIWNEVKRIRNEMKRIPIDQIWEQISDKLGRCLPDGVRDRYMYLWYRYSPARANWQSLIRNVRRRHRVAISWRALADGAVEHKEQRKAVEEERKKEEHKEELLGWLLGAARTPMAKTPTVKKSRFVGSGRGREEWQFPLSANLSANLDIIYSLRQELGFSHSPRKYTDEWWDKDSHFPAKKHKALCKLKYHYFAKRSPGYGALFSTERGGLDSSRSSRGRQQDLSQGTPQPASPPITDTELRSRLAAFQANGWRAVDAGGGGNCFFHALAKQVHGDAQRHGLARQETIRYMREHRGEFEGGVPGDFDSYVDCMSREGTSIEGEVEILAAANAFNVHIKVYGWSRDYDRTFSPLISNDETRPIYIVHDQAAQHYVVLERMDPAPTARGGLPRSMSASGRDLSLGTPSAPATARRPSTCSLHSAASERQVNAAIDSGAGAITPPQPPRPNSGPTDRRGLDRPRSSRELRQDSRGTPSARILPPASQLPRPNSGPTDLGGLDRSWSSCRLGQDSRRTPSATILPPASQLPRPISGPTDLGGLDRSWSQRPLRQDSRRTPSATSLYLASARSSSQSTNPATNSGMDELDA